jgi:hypothetical protein
MQCPIEILRAAYGKDLPNDLLDDIIMPINDIVQNGKIYRELHRLWTVANIMYVYGEWTRYGTTTPKKEALLDMVGVYLEEAIKNFTATNK